MRTRYGRWSLALGLAAGGAAWPTAPPARGQAPTLPGEGVLSPGIPATPGSANSLLGRPPGSGGADFASQAPGAGQILTGRPGPSTPKVPSSATMPGSDTPSPLTPGVQALPTVAPLTAVPIYAALDLPAVDDPGPAGGLTFEAALDRMLRANLDLLARRFEIPSARADELTASLRANPILYADSQLVPYGNYTRQRPGGQTQYDLNLSIPVDYSQKRKARIAVAATAVRIVEAQYQDAVRVQINNLATAYLSVLAARETIRYVDAGLKGLDATLEVARAQENRGDRTSADVARIEAQREVAAVGRGDAELTYRRALRALGVLLSIEPAEADRIEILAPVRVAVSPLQTLDALIATALGCRPDVVAARIGKTYAAQGLALQKANRYSDAYLLYQPYTFQNNAPVGLKSSYSYALGVTVPLPISNRNQGNIERAKLNIRQTDVQLTALERQVVAEVTQAEAEYRSTADFLARLEARAVPASKKALDDTRSLFNAGELKDVTLLLNIQKEFNDTIRLYRDTAVRHRRSMAALNAAVGSRILP